MAKTALITGASGGIGQALCDSFSQAGYRVIGTDKVVSDDLKCEEFILFDLEGICHSSEKLDEFIEIIREELFGDGLNVLVNNAALQILDSTSNIAMEDWSRTLDVNLSAPFYLVQGLLDDLQLVDGCVVNIASVHARATKPGFVAYATSKAALVGLTQALAVDLGGKVRVNAINPAATETRMLIEGFTGKMELYNELEKMHPMNRIAKPKEVADVAVFLASQQASFLTGSILDVDGGILSRLHDPD